MTPSNSPFGKNLKSLATRLTLWMRPKREEKEERKEAKEPEDVIVKPIATTPKPKTIRSPRVQSKPALMAAPVDEEEAKAKIAKAIEERIKPVQKQQAPLSENLVGKTTNVTIHGKKHTLMIRTDSLFIDAQKYIVSAGGGALGADVELDILQVTQAGNSLTLRAGAFGKEGTVTLEEQNLQDLIQGKTCKLSTDNHLTFEIARNSY